MFGVGAEAGVEADPVQRADGGEPFEVFAAVEDAVEYVLQLAFVNRQRIDTVIEQDAGFMQDAGAREDADAIVTSGS